MPFNAPDVHGSMLKTRARLMAANAYHPSPGLTHSEIPSAPSRPSSSLPARTPPASVHELEWPDDNDGWGLPTPHVYAAPYWLKLWGLATHDPPAWMITADGSSLVDLHDTYHGDPDILRIVAKEQATKRPRCEFFWRNGFCGRGDKCRYRHDVGDASPVCIDFKRSGKCPRGNACRRLHYADNWAGVKGVKEIIRNARIHDRQDEREHNRREMQRREREARGFDNGW